MRKLDCATTEIFVALPFKFGCDESLFHSFAVSLNSGFFEYLLRLQISFTILKFLFGRKYL